ncbi:MAG: glycosyltransferase family 2 protein [Myxococcota bacterium]
MEAGGPRECLVVVAPCFDEEEGLAHFVEAVSKALDETGIDYRIVLVDDGSADGTPKIMRELATQYPRVRPVFLSRNFGQQIAISAGLDAAKGADAVVVMDADMQHTPEALLALIEEWRRGGEVIMAVRRDVASVSLFKGFTSKLFYRVFNVFSDTKIQPGASDFFLLSANAHRAFLQLPERSRLVRGLLHWIGFDRRYVEYDMPPRLAGESKYSTMRMVGLALDGLISFSSRPIHVATRLGVVTAFAGMVYLAYVFGRALFVGDLAVGWGSIMATLLVLGGLQLTFIGLVGEYIARIYQEAKSRPLYVLRCEPDALGFEKPESNAKDSE